MTIRKYGSKDQELRSRERELDREANAERELDHETEDSGGSGR